MHGHPQANRRKTPPPATTSSRSPSPLAENKTSAPEPVWTRVDVWREVRPLQEEIDRLRAELKTAHSTKAVGAEDVSKLAESKRAHPADALEEARLALQLETDEATNLEYALEETRTEAAKESAAAYKGRAEGVQAANLVRASRAKLKEEESLVNRLSSALEEEEAEFDRAKQWATKERDAASRATTRASEETDIFHSLRSKFFLECDVAELAEERISQQLDEIGNLELELSDETASALTTVEEKHDLLRRQDEMANTLQTLRRRLVANSAVEHEMEESLSLFETRLESEELVAEDAQCAMLDAQSELRAEIRMVCDETEAVELSQTKEAFEARIARMEVENASLIRSGLTVEVDAARAEEKAMRTAQSEVAVESRLAREETAVARDERNQNAIEARIAREERDAREHAENDLSMEVLVVQSERKLASTARAELMGEIGALHAQRCKAEAVEADLEIKETVLSSLAAKAEREQLEISQLDAKVTVLQSEIEAETDVAQIEERLFLAARRDAASELEAEADVAQTERRLALVARLEAASQLIAEENVVQTEMGLALEARHEAASEEKALSIAASKMIGQQEEIAEYEEEVQHLENKLAAEGGALQVQEDAIRVARLDAAMRENAVSTLCAENQREQAEQAERLQCLRAEETAAGEEAHASQNAMSQLKEKMQSLSAELTAECDIASAHREAASSAQSKLTSQETLAAEVNTQFTHESFEAKQCHARSEDELNLQKGLHEKLLEQDAHSAAAQELIGSLRLENESENCQIDKVRTELERETGSAAHFSLLAAEKTQEASAFRQSLEDEASLVQQLTLQVQDHMEQAMKSLNSSLRAESNSPRIKGAWSLDEPVCRRCEEHIADEHSSTQPGRGTPLLVDSVCKLDESCSLDALFLRTQLTWEQESRAAQTKELMFLQYRVKELEDMIAGLRCGTAGSLPQSFARASQRSLDVDRSILSPTFAGFHMSPNGAQILPPLPPRQTPPPPNDENLPVSNTTSAGLVAFARLRRSFSNPSEADAELLANTFGLTAPPPVPIHTLEGKRRPRSPAAWASPRQKSDR